MWIIQLFTLLLAIFGIFCADDCESLPGLSNLRKCCEFPMLIEQNLREACTKEVEAESDTLESPKHFTKRLKFAECVFKKGDTIINGKPSVIEIKKMVKKTLEDYDGWEGPFNSAVDKCVPDVLAKDEMSRRRASESPFSVKNATTIYGHLIGCIFADLMFECPSASRGKGNECPEMINNMKKCFKDFPPRFLISENS